jgi:hypothetical protein
MSLGHYKGNSEVYYLSLITGGSHSIVTEGRHKHTYHYIAKFRHANTSIHQPIYALNKIHSEEITKLLHVSAPGAIISELFRTKE